MEILLDTKLPSPEISFVFLDWSCRESLHTLDYLRKQSVPRSLYEIIWIEYYDRKSEDLQGRLEHCRHKDMPPDIDQWIVLNIDKDIYYHKHLMYNVGIARSRGNIVCIGDSDAIVTPSFVETIIKEFKASDNLVLHYDEVRNIDKKCYPFNYPSIDELLSGVCINWERGKTTGLWDEDDPVHTRNYGAMMCARREDIIAVGGADEHIDYLGHVCGPYDLTWRLVNAGLTEKWHQTEFLYHTWHPGSDGDDNYIGPHDGKNVSTTALEAKASGRTRPLLESPAIEALRTGARNVDDLAPADYIDPGRMRDWSLDALQDSPHFVRSYRACLLEAANGCNIVEYRDAFFVLPQSLGPVDMNDEGQRTQDGVLMAATLDEARQLARTTTVRPEGPMHPVLTETICDHNIVHYRGRFYCMPHALGPADLEDEATRNHPAVLTTRTLAQARKLVRAATRPPLLHTARAIFRRLTGAS
ncbi:MAG: glycosyltransferase family 2 protein [Thermodesulfobacteriota bacterium]